MDFFVQAITSHIHEDRARRSRRIFGAGNTDASSSGLGAEDYHSPNEEWGLTRLRQLSYQPFPNEVQEQLKSECLGVVGMVGNSSNH